LVFPVENKDQGYRSVIDETEPKTIKQGRYHYRWYSCDLTVARRVTVVEQEECLDFRNTSFHPVLLCGTYWSNGSFLCNILSTIAWIFVFLSWPFYYL